MSHAFAITRRPHYSQSGLVVIWPSTSHPGTAFIRILQSSMRLYNQGRGCLSYRRYDISNCFATTICRKGLTYAPLRFVNDLNCRSVYNLKFVALDRSQDPCSNHVRKSYVPTSTGDAERHLGHPCSMPDVDMVSVSHCDATSQVFRVHPEYGRCEPLPSPQPILLIRLWRISQLRCVFSAARVAFIVPRRFWCTNSRYFGCFRRF